VLDVPEMTMELASFGGLLQSSPAAPEFDGKLQPLAGVRWPAGERRTAAAGEVALFEVTDPGELQEW
jgi:hypothetical protein